MSEQDNKTNEPTKSVEEITAEVTEQLKAQFDKQLGELKDSFKAKADDLDSKLKAAQKEAEDNAVTKEKVKKSAEQQIDEMRESHTELLKQLSTEKRDGAVATHLAGLDFVNNQMSTLAKQTITSQLQLVDGEWVGNNNTSVADVVKAFTEDENYKTMFKQAEPSGSNTAGSGGSTKATNVDNKDKDKPLKERDAGDVLKQINDGTFTPKSWGS